jgi:cell wall-associated NlpC family hydrolase
MRSRNTHFGSGTRHAALVVLALLLAAPLASAAPSQQLTLQQQVRELESEVGALESRYDGLQERFRAARIEQAKLEQESQGASQRLARTRTELARARTQLATRVIAIYQGSGTSPLVELAAAGSITEAFERVEAANTISRSDAEYVNSVIKLERRVEQQEKAARSARDAHAKVTRRMARDTRQMQRLLTQRRAALGAASARVREQMERDRRTAAARSTSASRERIDQLQSDGSTTQSSNTSSQPQGAPAASADANDGDGSGESSSATIDVPLPPSSGSAARAAQLAMGKVGAPYVWAAAGPDAFDCSGLVVWAFAQAGRPGLPHSTYSLITMGVEVPLSQAQIGDLVFTNSTGHMGIYVGGGQMVHSPRTGRTVSVEPLTYYSVTAVRRI